MTTTRAATTQPPTTATTKTVTTDILSRMGTEQFCLRWNDFHNNITTAFAEIRDHDDFMDVTLVCHFLWCYGIIFASKQGFYNSCLKGSYIGVIWADRAMNFWYPVIIPLLFYLFIMLSHFQFLVLTLSLSLSSLSFYLSLSFSLCLCLFIYSYLPLTLRLSLF